MTQDLFLVDTHCHLDLIEANNGTTTKTILERARGKGVKHILNVCVSLKDFPKVLAAAEQNTDVSASIGLHPNEQSETVTEVELTKLAEHPKIIAIGETGLDYYRSQGSLEWQRERFALHIDVAKNLHKPLIVHTRAAKEDTIGILRSQHAFEIGGIMHCFTEDWATAKAALDLNFYISFSGIVTFKNATSIQEVAKKVPDDRILIETDAPYLAPNPYRGKPNEPSYVYHTAEFLAALRGNKLETFAEITTANFFKLFPGANHV